jgi:hypothetical protein
MELFTLFTLDRERKLPHFEIDFSRTFIRDVDLFCSGMPGQKQISGGIGCRTD